MTARAPARLLTLALLLLAAPARLEAQEHADPVYMFGERVDPAEVARAGREGGPFDRELALRALAARIAAERRGITADPRAARAQAAEQLRWQVVQAELVRQLAREGLDLETPEAQGRYRQLFMARLGEGLPELTFEECAAALADGGRAAEEALAAAELGQLVERLREELVPAAEVTVSDEEVQASYLEARASRVLELVDVGEDPAARPRADALLRELDGLAGEPLREALAARGLTARESLPLGRYDRDPEAWGREDQPADVAFRPDARPGEPFRAVAVREGRVYLARLVRVVVPEVAAEDRAAIAGEVRQDLIASRRAALLEERFESLFLAAKGIDADHLAHARRLRAGASRLRVRALFVPRALGAGTIRGAEARLAGGEPLADVARACGTSPDPARPDGVLEVELPGPLLRAALATPLEWAPPGDDPCFVPPAVVQPGPDGAPRWHLLAPARAAAGFRAGPPGVISLRGLVPEDELEDGPPTSDPERLVFQVETDSAAAMEEVRAALRAWLTARVAELGRRPPFEELRRELSRLARERAVPAARGRGGALGLVAPPPGLGHAALLEVLAATPAGGRTATIETPAGWYVLEVLERTELDPAEQQRAARAALLDGLDWSER